MKGKVWHPRKGKGKTWRPPKGKGKVPGQDFHSDLTRHTHRAYARTTRNETISRLGDLAVSPPQPPIYIYIYICIYTSADPCIPCTENVRLCVECNMHPRSCPAKRLRVSSTCLVRFVFVRLCPVERRAGRAGRAGSKSQTSAGAVFSRPSRAEASRVKSWRSKGSCGNFELDIDIHNKLLSRMV